MSLPICPQCQENHTYTDGHLYVCPLCFYEWTDESQRLAEEAQVTRDSNGNELNSGDDVTVIRDLKLGKDMIKQGTRVRNIKLLEQPVNDHDIEARIDGFGTVYLKSSVVKK